MWIPLAGFPLSTVSGHMFLFVIENYERDAGKMLLVMGTPKILHVELNVLSYIL